MHLYAQDNVSMSDVMKWHNWEHVRCSVLTLTPRRYGKTTAVAAYLAAYALNVSGSECAVFSTGKRASGKMLELIAQLVCQAGGAERIAKQNQEQLWIRGDVDGDIRKISSYPSAVSTLRGCGGDVIVLEEAAFIDTEVFLQVVVPLLQLENTALIAISTPQGSDNYYSKLFTLTDASGRPFFTTLRVGLICPKCQAENKQECPHVIAADTKPPWQSDAKHDLVCALYGNRTDLMAAEIMGAAVDDKSAAFDPAEVKRAIGRTLRVDARRVQHVLTACDPNGGGSSEMALISVCLQNAQVCVLAMSAKATRGYDEITKLLVDHLGAVARMLPQAVQVFACENNLGNEAAWCAAEIRRRRLRNVKIAYEKAHLAGVRTTNASKVLQAGEMKRFLTTNALGMANGMLLFENASVEALGEQLEGYRKITRTNKFGTASQTFSGKANGPDDLCVTLGLACYWVLQMAQGLLNAEA